MAFNRPCCAGTHHTGVLLFLSSFCEIFLLKWKSICKFKLKGPEISPQSFYYVALETCETITPSVSCVGSKWCIVKVDYHHYLYSWMLCNNEGVATMRDGQLFTSVATRLVLRGHLKVFRSVDILWGGGGGGAKQLSCDRSRNLLKSLLYSLCCVHLNDGLIITAWRKNTKK